MIADLIDIGDHLPFDILPFIRTCPLTTHAHPLLTSFFLSNSLFFFAEKPVNVFKVSEEPSYTLRQPSSPASLMPDAELIRTNNLHHPHTAIDSGVRFVQILNKVPMIICFAQI